MATYNGYRWIEPQIDSILYQSEVDVRLVVSDDGSTDGTAEYLAEREESESRLLVLQPGEGRRGVAGNFLHLFATHPATANVYVAFSDQDDVWRPNKLIRQIDLLRELDVDAVSSNVVSFDARGHERLIIKNAPQRRWDYIFEAAGPGSTYVFTPQVHAQLVADLAMLDIAGFEVHDWLLYALVRASGGKWFIDGSPLVEYRQHGDNVQGEHHGIGAAWHRFLSLRSGFYREQFLLTAQAAKIVGSDVQDQAWRDDLDDLITDLSSTNFGSRLRIARRHRQMRRSFGDGWALAAACLLGIW
jgi:rhamnosyltransferase